VAGPWSHEGGIIQHSFWLFDTEENARILSADVCAVRGVCHSVAGVPGLLRSHGWVEAYKSPRVCLVEFGDGFA
jgi:hypothetical protein